MTGSLQPNWVVYVLQCCDGSYYTGATNNLTRRVDRHQQGKGAKYTKARLPVQLVVSSPLLSKSAALSLEYHVKQLPRDKKLAAVREGGVGDEILKLVNRG